MLAPLGCQHGLVVIDDTSADIESRDDVEALVRAFYATAFEDPLLRPIFVDVAHLDTRLDAHLPLIVDFWESVLLHTGVYGRSAFDVHQALNDQVGLQHHHFDRWVQLWTQAVHARYSGQRADSAIRQAQRFANAFERRLRSGDDGANASIPIRVRPVDPGEPGPTGRAG